MKISDFRKSAGNLLTGVILLALIALASCSKDPSADLGDILNTVPSDVACVGVYDTGNLIKKAGGKVDGDKAELSGGLKTFIEKQAGTDPQMTSVIDAVLKGEAGVSFGPGAFFVEGSNAYVTGMLSNPDDFKSFCEEKMQAKFTETDGVEAMSGIAVKDNRFWIGVKNTSSIDTREIVRFLALTDQQSFLSNPISEKMLKLEDDLTVWGSLNGLMNLGKIGFGNLALYRMALSSVFDDIQDFYLTTDFDKGEMSSELELLNSKGKTAKFLLPTVKIDESTVKSLGGSASMVMAVGINKKLVSKIKEMLQTFGGTMPSLYNSVLDVLDGTACAALSSDGEGVNGIVTTTGEGTAVLTGVLNNFGTVTKDGKLLRVKKGTVDGTLDVANAASMLDDSMLGIVVSDIIAVDKYAGVTTAPDAGNWFSSIALLLKPSDGGMKVKLVCNCKDSGMNALEAILKSASESTVK